jgi:hypothetical protein
MSNEIIGYTLIDGHTKKVLKEYKSHQRKTARNRADKLDNIYGAYRYHVKPVYN